MSDADRQSTGWTMADFIDYCIEAEQQFRKASRNHYDDAGFGLDAWLRLIKSSLGREKTFQTILHEKVLRGSSNAPRGCPIIVEELFEQLRLLREKVSRYSKGSADYAGESKAIVDLLQLYSLLSVMTMKMRLSDYEFRDGRASRWSKNPRLSETALDTNDAMPIDYNGDEATQSQGAFDLPPHRGGFLEPSEISFRADHPTHLFSHAPNSRISINSTTSDRKVYWQKTARHASYEVLPHMPELKARGSQSELKHATSQDAQSVDNGQATRLEPFASRENFYVPESESRLPSNQYFRESIPPLEDSEDGETFSEESAPLSSREVSRGKIPQRGPVVVPSRGVSELHDQEFPGFHRPGEPHRAAATDSPISIFVKNHPDGRVTLHRLGEDEAGERKRISQRQRNPVTANATEGFKSNVGDDSDDGTASLEDMSFDGHVHHDPTYGLYARVADRAPKDNNLSRRARTADRNHQTTILKDGDSLVIPNDGTPVTFIPKSKTTSLRNIGEPVGESDLLFEYFEDGLDGSSEPKVRVKVSPSKKKGLKDIPQSTYRD